jgi:hypothetical protein
MIEPKEALEKFADRVIAYKPKTGGMKKRIKKRAIMIGSTGKRETRKKKGSSDTHEQDIQ